MTRDNDRGIDLPPADRRRGLATLAVAVACATLASLALTACGGGGDAGPTPPPPPSLPPVNASPVAVQDPGSTLPEGWQDGAFMEIFVRSYQDSDGDGFGDLAGLTQRLDYLQDLGIRGIWLMPVTASADHDHGYAVADYRGVEAAYGSMADLDAFIAAAHARGIAVVLDYVMNHSAVENPFFVNAANARTNPYRDWYVWQDSHPAGWSIYGHDPWVARGGAWYYGSFWSGMPDWNLRNADVVAYHHDNLRFWLNRGVDGFRFDAVGNLVENGPSAWEIQPENDALMADVREGVLGAYARRWMVCEVPAAPQRYGAAGVCGSAFAFDVNQRVAQAAQGDTAALQAVAQYFVDAPAGMSTMVSNHDGFAGARLWDQVAGDPSSYRLAAATYLMLPGTPFVYYGEEVGMSGGAGLVGDAWLRSPMSWTANAHDAGFTTMTPYRALASNVATNNVESQLADPQSLHAWYRGLLGLRNTRPSIAHGAYVAPQVTGRVMSFQRVLGAERTLVVIDADAADGTLAVGALPAGATVTPIWPDAGAAVVADGSGTATLPVAGRSARVYAVTGP